MRIEDVETKLRSLYRQVLDEANKLLRSNLY